MMIGEIDHEVLSEDLVVVEPEKEEGHGDEDRGETPQSSSSRLAKICRLRKMIVHHPLQEVEKKGKEKKERKKKRGTCSAQVVATMIRSLACAPLAGEISVWRQVQVGGTGWATILRYQ